MLVSRAYGEGTIGFVDCSETGLEEIKYQVNASEIPALVCLPDEGNGILIAKQEVVTAAHAVVWRPVREVTLNGVPRPVAKVIVHPGHKAAPKELKSGEAAALMEFMNSSDDVALIDWSTR